MKKIPFSLFLVFVTLGLHAQNGYWEEAKGPYGNDGDYNFKVIATNNGVLYATGMVGLTATIYTSKDNGHSWKEIDYIQPNNFVDLIRVNIAQSGNFYTEFLLDVLKSSDEGNSWTVLPVPDLVSKVIETNSGTLIAWDEQTNKVHRSTDEGQTWFLIDSMPADDIEGKIELQVTPFGGAILAKTDGISFNKKATYISFDDGQSWSRISVDSKYDLSFISATGALFFTANGAVLRTSSIGQPLVLVSSLPINGLTMLPSGRILGSVLNAEMQYSDDDGLTWHQLTSDSDVSILQNIAQFSDSTLYSFVHGALSRSEDGGNTWQFTGYGIRKGKITQMRAISDSSYVAFTQFGLWKTENGGLDWNLLASTKKGNNLRYFELLETGGIVSIHNNKLFFADSLNGSLKDITPIQAQLNASSNKVFVNPSNNHFYLSTINGLFRSEDLGQSWEVLSNLPYIRYMSFHPSGRIIANSNKKVLYSDNNSQNWTEVNNPLPNQLWIDRTWVTPNGSIFLVSYSSPEYDFIAYSEDRGETWSVVGRYPQAGITPNAVTFTANNQIYVTNYDHTYASVTKGQTWQALPCPESPTATNCQRGIYLAINPDYRLFLQTETYECYKTTSPVTQGAYLEGYVRLDADADCTTQDAQAPINNINIQAQGSNFSYFTSTDSLGHYLFFVDTGAYQVKAHSPNQVWWNFCANDIKVDLPDLFITDTVDFAALPLSFCPLITVNVGIPLLRRCFNNEVYIAYCNHGTEPADSAWVDVMLDPYLSLTDSDQPHEILGDNTIRFFIGNVPSGECDQFRLSVHVNCDSTVIGQTHCITAHGFPDTLCTTVPDWSGANIEASVTCQDTTLRFKLENTGAAHSESLEYIIIEDDVVLFTGQKDYEVAEDLILDFPANGKTWRIESAQEPGHPFSRLALAFAEGCGGFNSLGYINQFPVNGIEPSWHRMCVENIGSYDPNDKQGFPTGTSSEHNIRPRQAIDYLIRFQNTGTDTAFTVVIRDTLSAFLDPLSFRSGASIHPYTWELSGQGVINFRFNNIMLPDSNVNEPASHGFVQFTINPYASVPLGSVIENEAAIYFDFNAPVFTNTTWHTIEKSPLTSAIQPEPKTVESSLEIWPNPFSDRTNIRFKEKKSSTMFLKIFDSRGCLVAQKTALGSDLEFNGKHLPSGLYWAEIRDEKGALLGNGKLIKE